MTNLYVILLPQMDEKRKLGYMVKIGYSKDFKESRNKYGYGQYHRTVEVLHLYEGDFTLDDELKLKQYFKGVKRLWGKDRFETNLAVLREAGGKESRLTPPPPFTF
jgi:hypothetical protein